ncbi:MAG TPA: response regulator [Candidatus Paceibacterota bacterium]
MKSVKILFIEDDDLLRSLFSEALTLDTERAYTILSALDLKSGKAILQSTQPDIIVLDLILPYDKAANQNDLSEKMGLNLLREIKQDSRLKSVPVIIFSNLGDESIKKETLKSGATEHLMKSETTPEKFLEIIKRLLQ